jgi:hypothetical protein
MSEATHWRNYARSTVTNRTDDSDHVLGGVRWNSDGTRALVRFRGAKISASHLTPSEARALVRSDLSWIRWSAL